jgi:hypothetical protein
MLGKHNSKSNSYEFSIPHRYKGFKKDCPNGQLTEQVIAIFVQQ